MGTSLLRNRNANISKIPKPPIRRSIFDANWRRSQTMNASFITPIMCKKVVPGQSMFLNLTSFIRLNTQITCPVDNLQIETFFFYCPERLGWENHPYFIGAVKDPNKEQSYLTPQIEIPAAKNTAGSLFNLLSASRINKKIKVSKIPFVIHNLIYNEYFRDSDCESPKKVDITDADGNIADYDLYRIHKSRDYFTNSTRDISKGNTVTIPIGTEAPVTGDGNGLLLTGGQYNQYLNMLKTNDNNYLQAYGNNNVHKIGEASERLTTQFNDKKVMGVPKDIPQGFTSGLIARLDQTTGATIDALRQAIMINEFQEALNRGGTKYVDVMKNIYDVTIPDLTIQRPLYLGGTSTPFYTNPVVQTSATQATGTVTPQGNIAGYGTGGDSGRVINASFQEFGYVIGYCVIKAQPQYQQGIDRFWMEKDKFDYFNPFFNNASDQAILREEIYMEDYDAVDENQQELNKKVFGYIGRNDHLRYQKNEIAGELNSEYSHTLDMWHYAEKFENAPENNADFMQDKTYDILDRTVAVVWEDEGKTIKSPQFIAQFDFTGANALPIPVNARPKISALL